MGIFDFVKDAGAKLFGRSDKAAEKHAPETEKADTLMSAVRQLGLQVADLKIAFADGTATIEGKVPNQTEREKIVLVVGNTQGVARVDDRMSVGVPQPEAVFYTVKKGDTLSAIAKAHYGSAQKYPLIFEANRPMLKNPDLIYPGQMLRIPPQ